MTGNPKVGTTPLLFLNSELAEGAAFDLFRGEVVIFTHRCPGEGGLNEDCAAIIPVTEDTTILAVADGAGGQRAGEQASRTAVEALLHSLEQIEKHDPESLGSAILSSFELTNKTLLEQGIGSATTLSVALIVQNVVRSFHAGDSRLLIFSQRGRVKFQTTIHSPVGYAVEAGVLDEAEAIHHEERHLVSNLLGTTSMSIEVTSPTPLASKDTLVIMSDGLYDNLTSEEIANHLRSGDLAHRAGELASSCRTRMTTAAPALPSKPDDLTFIAYRPGR